MVKPIGYLHLWLTVGILLTTLISLSVQGNEHNRTYNDVSFGSREILSTKDDAVKNCTRPATESFPDDKMSLAFKRNGGVLLHIFVALYAFGALAVVCNYYFLSAMEAICERLGLSEDVAGATFMAIGTSAPEIGTAIIGVFVTKSNVGLDTVAGSTVFNMFFITAICGLFGIHHIHIKRWPVIRDSVCFMLAAITLIAVTSDGYVTWFEGLLVSLVYVVYILIMAFSRKIEIALERCSKQRYGTTDETTALLSQHDSSSKMYDEVIESALSASRPSRESSPRESERTRSTESLSGSSGYRSSNDLDNSLASSKTKYGHSVVSLADLSDGYKSQLTWPQGCFTRVIWIIYLPVSILFFLTIPDCNRPGRWRYLYPVTFISSVCWVSGLAYLLVWMIEVIGEVFFIPEAIMGITFLAIGTSIPDAIASLLACRRGYGDMALSNILGSNILDLVCTGLPWLIKTGVITPNSVIYTGTASVVFTIISLLTCSVLVILGFMVVKWTLDKRIGFSYLALYAIYIVICVLYELNYFGSVNLPMCPEGTI